MPSSTNVDNLRLELIQRGVSVSHPLIQGKIKIHPELQADMSAMFYYATSYNQITMFPFDDGSEDLRIYDHKVKVASEHCNLLLTRLGWCRESCTSLTTPRPACCWTRRTSRGSCRSCCGCEAAWTRARGSSTPTCRAGGPSRAR